MSPKILVVGCGITGSAISRYIASIFPTLKPSFTFWDKNEACGGRMISNYQLLPPASDATEKTVYHCDMGGERRTLYKCM